MVPKEVPVKNAIGDLKKATAAAEMVLAVMATVLYLH